MITESSPLYCDNFEQSVIILQGSYHLVVLSKYRIPNILNHSVAKNKVFLFSELRLLFVVKPQRNGKQRMENGHLKMQISSPKNSQSTRSLQLFTGFFTCQAIINQQNTSRMSSWSSCAEWPGGVLAKWGVGPWPRSRPPSGSRCCWRSSGDGRDEVRTGRKLCKSSGQFSPPST